MREGIFNLSSAALAALVTYIGLKRSAKKETEDLNIARTGQAVETWMKIAEANKDHWDECEKKNTENAFKIDELNTKILELYTSQLKLISKINQMELQIHGKIEL